MLFRSTMNFGDWMAVSIPPEKLFQIEKQCRTLQSSPKAGEIAAKLLKQTSYQQEILQAAVNEIARLELMLMDR